MKLIHISHLYHPSSGGVQFFFKNISERLVKDYGDEVTIVTTNSLYGPERRIFKRIEPQQEVINGVKVIRFPFRRWHITPYSFLFKLFAKLSLNVPGWMLLQANGPYSRQMKKYLMTVEADAFCGSSSGYYFMQLPLWRRTPFYYYGSIHLRDDDNRNLLLPQQLASINASTLYLANTNYEKNKLIKAGVKQEKVFVLGTGVDMTPFISVTSAEVENYKKELDIPKDALLVGYVGRIERTKNVQLLVKAFEKISLIHQNVYLLIAGSGSDFYQELQSHCNNFSKEISNRIRWQKDFPVEVKRVLFNTIDILVLPSHNESFGLVFLEAWSCKKPVIGASIGAVRDVIDEGVDGLLMDVNDEKNLAEKLLKLINDKSLRTKMGENGFKKVKENYTWEIIVARLRQCYVNGKTLENNI